MKHETLRGLSYGILLGALSMWMASATTADHPTLVQITVYAVLMAIATVAIVRADLLARRERAARRAESAEYRAIAESIRERTRKIEKEMEARRG